MPKAIGHNRYWVSRRFGSAQRGQTLIVAIAVLFVLLFIGGLFVAEIARNLTSAGRSRDTQSADALAEAGIRYCDDELTHSAAGADWRPAPTPPTDLTDPDFQWLNQGYARIAMRGGRALVRVSYDPHPDDPRSQYLRIDAVGRPGELGNGTDPTIFVQTGNPPRLRSERVAYKAIGLTDYVRFITDKTHSGVEDFLGVPAGAHNVSFVVGDPTSAEFPTGLNGSNLIINAGIRCNTNLRIGGDFFLYASARGNKDANGNPMPEMSPEGMQVAGQILLGPTRDVNGDGVIGDGDHQAFINQVLNYTGLVNNPDTDANTAPHIIRPSNDPLFDASQGYLRDNSTNPDVNGFTRSIPRLDPPSLSEFAAGSRVLRYRALTRDSGIWVPNNGNPFNTGLFGWGSGVYINNPSDLQQETAKPGINGGYSLRSDWLNPRAYGTYWQGPFYRPPGIDIWLRGDRALITRDDDRVFTKPDGTPITEQGGKVIEIPFADSDRDNYVFPDGTTTSANQTNPGTLPPLPHFPHDGDDPGAPNRPYGDPNSYGVNVVIMAEGNVRVHGIYGAVTSLGNPPPQGQQGNVSRVHLTIVSGGTAYVEGNVIKGDGYIDNTGQLHRERASTCAILAKDYVCVNTTMFMSPENQTNVSNATNPDVDFFTTEIGQTKQTYDMSFSFGVDPSTYLSTFNGSSGPTPLFLMMRHAALNPGPSYIDMLINPGLANQATINADFGYDYAIYPFNGDPTLSILGFAYGVSLNYVGGTLVQSTAGVAPYFEQKAFPLVGQMERQIGTTPNYFIPTLNGWNSYFPSLVGVNPAQAGSPPSIGVPNVLRLQIDNSVQGLVGSGGSTDYLLGNAAVAPLDIRIEALLYAENKSFFVIPGYPFNTDPNDNRPNFNNTGARQSYTGPTDTDKYAKDIVPFYNEPTDIRITVYGAIAENYTASIGDQAAWLEKWGYIPATFGSTYSDNTPARIPDDHRMAHDPAGYMPAEDRTQDWRTPFESQNPAANIPTQYKDFELTRGLRFVYDPAFAMPYYAPWQTPTTDAATATRAQQALRVIHWPAVQKNGATLMNDVYQTLPPIPRLPVCPGLLYFGNPDTNLP